MNAIRVRQRLSSQILDLPELASMVGKDVEIIVIEEPQAVGLPAGPKAGSAKGEIWMADDFDAPLDDFADHM